METQRLDPAQEFAERVTDEWFNFKAGKLPRSWKHVQLIFLIADGIRAEGWRSREDWLRDMTVALSPVTKPGPVRYIGKNE